ncbi:DUF350 domain-containing protein [Algicola sagamiensis]|uniref:DUF350 domain-containing protein n=1 Tax=Algicola sagamiensis TaxID=163869 RepID=UPI00037FA375|nr:DUF350 domain-containing protein [Algicola sagamiensis]
MIEFNSVQIWNMQAMAVDFVIIFILIVALRLMKGVVSNVHTTDEIANRDNFAFGVSFAGGIAAIAIMLTGVSEGEAASSLINEAINMTVFGVIGIIMVFLGRIVQDKFVLRRVDIHAEIVKGNLAAALVDLGHVLSVAIIIRAAMLWVTTEGWMAIPIVVASFVISQFILLLASKYRVRLFISTSEDENCMQRAMADGHSALSLRYAGYLIGTSLAITAASNLIPYNPESIALSVAFWAAAAIIMSFIFALLKGIAMRVILPGVNVSDEVDRQHNIGVSAIEVAVALAIGLSFVTLLA